ncbi:MAG: adenosylmethionine decarboxylase [Planctomycetes bacterium]|jgi:S-adenosylmethionine decarboxylase proenzyme|nr:adenosylmethionine decarboxylase [Planctomycetota bacterium]
MRALLDLVLIDLYECEHETLLDKDEIKVKMLEAARLMGAQVVAVSFYTFAPFGVSGTITIAESHLAVHTWPEYDFAAITFETCGADMDLAKAYDFLVAAFGSKRPVITLQKRGFIDANILVQPVKQGGDILCPP